MSPNYKTKRNASHLPRIAIVDGDREARDNARVIVISAGYLAIPISSGAEAIEGLRRDRFDLILLDRTLPDLSGIEILRWMKANLSAVPAVIMITDSAASDDVAEALELGADDYIVKPVMPQALVARMEAALHRAAVARPAGGQRLLFYGPYCFDRKLESVTFDRRSIRLTTTEFALALFFFQNANRALSRDQILETIWQTNPEANAGTLDSYVSRIRTKLEIGSDHGFRLSAVTGPGYRLERDPDLA